MWQRTVVIIGVVVAEEAILHAGALIVLRTRTRVIKSLEGTREELAIANDLAVVDNLLHRGVGVGVAPSDVLRGIRE